MIRSGDLANSGQLPSEGELARTLGVSRPTVREALALLQVEGIVTRRHGSGSFVNAPPETINARVDELLSIPQLISKNGLRPEMTNLEVRRVSAPRATTRALRLPAGSNVTVVRRLYLANGRPAVWAIDYLPDPNLATSPAWEEFQGDLLAFLREQVGKPVAYATAAISLREADQATALELRLKPRTSVLWIDQVAYTAHHEPVAHSIGANSPGMIRFHVFRRVV
jgi:GntR family transcriptional regulator